MIRIFRNIFYGKSLSEKLNETKKIKVQGVYFEIKKLDVQDYLTGSKVMLSMFETYSVVPEKPTFNEAHAKKMKEHLADVFLSCVLSPSITRKEEKGSIFVDHLFNDWSLVNELYEEIIKYTFGKKKLSK